MSKKKTIIIKIGTSTLTSARENGERELDVLSFRRIAQQARELRQKGYDVIIVSSAAITAGMMLAGVDRRPDNSRHIMPLLQSYASIGWRQVLNCWALAFDDIVVGELLVTKAELELSADNVELMAVTRALLDQGFVPIVNENDAITHEEIAFGDNDTLAAIFAGTLRRSHLFGDDVSLVILSDIDGVYEDITDTRTLISEIEDIDVRRDVAATAMSATGTGGMITKFAAAKICQDSGVAMYIANGRRDDVIGAALERKVGTYFRPNRATYPPRISRAPCTPRA